MPAANSIYPGMKKKKKAAKKKVKSDVKKKLKYGRPL